MDWDPVLCYSEEWQLFGHDEFDYPDAASTATMVVVPKLYEPHHSLLACETLGCTNNTLNFSRDSIILGLEFR